MDKHVVYHHNIDNSIKNIIKAIYEKLLSDKECFFEYYSESNEHFVFLKYIECIKPRQIEIQDHEVPITIIKIDEQFKQAVKQYDTKLYRLLDLIQGKDTVKKITQQLKDIYKPEQIQRALSDLVNFQVILMIDLFMFSNHYMLTNKINKFIDNQQLQQNALIYISQESGGQKRILKKTELISLYLSIKKENNVYQTFVESVRCQKFVDKVNIVEFIVFGVVHGIIRRVHEYPIIPKPGEFNFNNIITEEKFVNLENRYTSEDYGLEPMIFSRFKELMIQMVLDSCSIDQFLVTFKITREELKNFWGDSIQFILK